MRRTIATAFAALIVVAASAPALAGSDKKAPVQQSVAPGAETGGHSGGGCYDGYKQTPKPTA